MGGSVLVYFEKERGMVSLGVWNGYKAAVPSR